MTAVWEPFYKGRFKDLRFFDKSSQPEFHPNKTVVKPNTNLGGELKSSISELRHGNGVLKPIFSNIHFYKPDSSLPLI